MYLVRPLLRLFAFFLFAVLRVAKHVGLQYIDLIVSSLRLRWGLGPRGAMSGALLEPPSRVPRARAHGTISSGAGRRGERTRLAEKEVNIY